MSRRKGEGRVPECLSSPSGHDTPLSLPGKNMLQPPIGGSNASPHFPLRDQEPEAGESHLETEAALQGKGKPQWQEPGWSSGCGCLLGTPPLMRVPLTLQASTPQMVRHHEAFRGVLLPNGSGQPSGSLCGALPGRGCGPRPPGPLT